MIDQNSKKKSIKVLINLIKEMIDNGKLTMNEIIMILNEKVPIDKTTSDQMNVIESLEKQAAHLSNELSELIKKELKRLSREFVSNEYERRFKINFDTVALALFGEDRLNSEKQSLKKKENVFYIL